LDGTGRFFDAHLEALSLRYRALPWAFRPRAHFDYQDLMEELGEATSAEPPGSITVVGESFGGTVALHFVLAYPGRVRILGLINTFCYYGNRLRIEVGCRLAPLLRARGVSALKNYISDRILILEGIPLEGRGKYREVVAMIDPEAYMRRLQLVREVDLRERLAEIKVPMVIMAAGRDKVVPSSSSARFIAARVPDARVHSFPHAGHALLLTPGFSLADYV
jgi:pimeloyl-ACP methyl ester carboxylesterase